MTMFFVVVILFGWFASYYFNNPAILIGAVIFSIVMNIMSYWFSDKIVLSMSGAQPIKREINRELYNIVENLAITAGLPTPKIYIINDPAPNAFATGRDPEHAVVAVTTGLLSILDRVELEGVIAHELSHIGNRDMLVSTVVVVLVGFVSLLSDFFLRWSLFGGSNENRDGRVGVILAIVGIVLAILAPIVATLIQLAISRKREYLADASGALLTRYPEGLASALEKIGGHKGTLMRANHATAHLYIADPYKTDEDKEVLQKNEEEKISFLSQLFATHPPIKDRVNALLGKK